MTAPKKNTGPKYEPYDFANRRHIGPSPAEMEKMLEACGVADLDELIDQTSLEYVVGQRGNKVR